MGFLDAVRSIQWQTIWLIIIGFIPYVDQETIGVVPILRDIVPFAEPIYLLELSWTERGRLVVLILVPIVDGEWIQLFTGMTVPEVISD